MADPGKRRVASELSPKRFSIIGLISAGLSLTVVVTIVGFFDRHWWVADVISNFRVQYAVCGLVAAVIMILVRRNRTAAVSLAVLILNMLPVLSVYVGRSPASGMASSAESQSSIRVLLCNVWSDNKDFDKLRSCIQREEPDIIILQEVTEKWLQSMPELRISHPHYIEYPEVDNFGIALYSRQPLENVEIIKVGEMQLASVHAVLRNGDKRMHLVGTHPLPPGGKEYWGWRNNQLAGVADYIRERAVDDAVVLVGDLNCTPWTYYFQQFENESGLTHAGRGRRFHVSWPAFFPPARIPIDHCLVSPTVEVKAFRALEDIGSDHYPLLVDIIPY